eukprot:Amastigsp_a513349_11.p4 type:complete len:114 gc:universal Amastigsp_a513349_11:817-1158(+)
MSTCTQRQAMTPNASTPSPSENRWQPANAAPRPRRHTSTAAHAVTTTKVVRSESRVCRDAVNVAVFEANDERNESVAASAFSSSGASIDAWSITLPAVVARYCDWVLKMFAAS